MSEVMRATENGIVSTGVYICNACQESFDTYHESYKEARLLSNFLDSLCKSDKENVVRALTGDQNVSK